VVVVLVSSSGQHLVGVGSGTGQPIITVRYNTDSFTVQYYTS